MLERIHIKNFRSCRDVEFSVSEGVCALIGKNGVGKTNILKAVDWLASSVVKPESIKIARTQLLRVDQEVEVDLAFQIENQHYDYSLIYHHPFYAKTSDSRGMRETLGVQAEGGSRREILNREGGEVSLWNRTEPVRLHRYTPSIGALGSLLSESDPIRSELTPPMRYLESIRYYPLNLESIEQDSITEAQYEGWLAKYQDEGGFTDSVPMRLLYMKKKDPGMFDHFLALAGPNGIDLISEARVLNYNMSRIENWSEPDNPSTYTLYLPSFKPSQSMGGHGKLFPFSELSSGTRHIIRLITSLLFDKSSVMLVEQPEDSIHPEMLRKLISIFRTYSYDGSPYSSQIIFTTHSPDVLDILKPEEVRLVTAEEGETCVRPLNHDELGRAKWFLKNEGTLSEFLEPIER